MFLCHLGLFVHFILILAASDIFFRHHPGKSEWKCDTRKPIAKRVVFIVADGLDENQLMRYSKETVVETAREWGKGSWGYLEGTPVISSIAGNLAFLTGYDADPAITYFSKIMNEPVAIDNVMNRSNSIYFSGDKEVYNYIYKDHKSKWAVNFSPDWKHSLSNPVNYTLLNEYIVTDLNTFLLSSHSHSKIKDFLDQDKTIFYFQLGFIADSVRMFGRYSNQTSQAAKEVFNTIEDVVNSINDYYNDDAQTTFILCSNHGFDNLDHLPFVTWGAGIYKSSVNRIKQSDISALISTLLGLQFPTSSRSVLPYTLLNNTSKHLVEAMLCNSIQVYNLARQMQKAMPMYRHNFTLTPCDVHNKLLLYSCNFNFTKFHVLAQSVVNLSLREIQFYEFFSKSIVWYCSLITSMCWIILLFSVILPCKESLDNKALVAFSLIKEKVASKLNTINSQVKFALKTRSFSQGSQKNNHTDTEWTHEITANVSDNLESDGHRDPSTSVAVIPQNLVNSGSEKKKALVTWKWMRGMADILFFLIVTSIFIVLYIYDMEPMMLMYCTTPVLILWLCSYTIIDWTVFAKDYLPNIWKSLVLYCVVLIFSGWLLINGLETWNSLNLEFGILIIFQSVLYMKKPSYVIIVWLLSGCAIMVFSGSEVWNSLQSNQWFLIISCFLLILWSSYAIYRVAPKDKDFFISIILLFHQFTSVGLVVFIDVMHLPDSSMMCVNILSWLLLSAVFYPAIHTDNVSALVLNTCLALSVPVILFSTAFEPLLYILISNFMLSWLILEGYSNNWAAVRNIEGEDVRRALLFSFFVFFINSAMGSNHSFMSSNLQSVQLFVNTTSEPTLWLLFLLKPFFIYTLITAVFLIICSSNGVKIGKGFILVLLILQVVAINLFLRIKFHQDGELSDDSIQAAFDYFNINIFTTLLMLTILFCSYVYRLPVPKSVSFK